MKILFITHDASRTGAPYSLLYFLRWLSKNSSSLEILVLAIKGGELSSEFKEVSRHYLELKDLKAQKEISLKKKIDLGLKKIGFKKRLQDEDHFVRSILEMQLDLIYANTVISLPIAAEIKRITSKPVILHVHESQVIINLRAPNFSDNTKYVDTFIAASKFVKNQLTDKYLVPEEKIRVVYETSQIKSFKNKKPVNSLTIGGVGNQFWRKGGDLFIQVANYIKMNYPEIECHFTWVGGLTKQESILFDADIEKAGLQKMLEFKREIENPFDIFSDFDILLMTSREDPFPLVCIELGMMGKPIILFERTTGTEEVIKEGGGKIVPFLDIAAMAGAVVYYYNNRKELEKDGEKAKQLFSKFSPESISPRILSIIKELE